MSKLRPINQKARRIEAFVNGAAPAQKSAQASGQAAGQEADVEALQNGQQNPPPRPHVPMGCSLAFSPGWEVDSSGGTAGLCQPVERDIYDCYVTCFWPAQVPDHMNNYPDWADKCSAATKDWRELDIVFP